MGQEAGGDARMLTAHLAISPGNLPPAPTLGKEKWGLRMPHSVAVSLNSSMKLVRWEEL